ncbi:hypothetical protein AB0I77_45255 [Streptomyces sp. NPDC050619]|uniref:hypothetical protein n=1 Tax=Streptomyces sp. NPDC050619 TaxID=3157214 RepID=UPI00343237CD
MANLTVRARIVVWAVAVLCGLGAAGLVVLVVAVDLNTADQAASVAGALVGIAGLAVSVYALCRTPVSTGSDASVEAGGVRSVAAGGNIGRVVTGDNASLTTAAPAPPFAAGVPRGPTFPARATGERGIAAAGDIGEAITGDGSQT